MEFFASCARGLEPVLGEELRALRVRNVRPVGGGVSFGDSLEDAYRALLWSRVASRILLTLERFDAVDASALYAGVKAVAWEDHLAPDATVAVAARGVTDALRDTRFTALKTKDAICDRLREVRGFRPDVDTAHPDLSVQVVLHRGKVTISLDLSGEALHKRGYRGSGKGTEAPLRETTAAAILLRMGWATLAPQSTPFAFWDPMCGSGTLVIEAAQIAADIAPRLERETWGFTRWLQHDETVWNKLHAQAVDRAAAGRTRLAEAGAQGTLLLGSDCDANAIDIARRNASAAGVEPFVRFEQADVGDADAVSCARAQMQGSAGTNDGAAFHILFAATNPPYGERLSTLSQLPATYVALKQALVCAKVDKLALITADESIDFFLQAQATHVLRTSSGQLESTIRMYGADALGTAAGKGAVFIRDTKIAVDDAGAQQFASRLNKVAKQRAKWAKSNDVFSYRVYDADLPDFNFAIDVYDCGKAGRKVHVAEYAAPKNIDTAKVQARLADALRIIPVVFEVGPDAVYLKQRRRAKGGSQYAKKTGGSVDERDVKRGGRRLVTCENRLFFEVNLGEYLDTGLFLDHRDTRALVRKLARDKSFLNLFAYTGTASVYAAAGGARFTTTVDMSNTYLEWAQRNFELNGFKAAFGAPQGHAKGAAQPARRPRPDHELVRADVLQWVRDQRHSRNRWDLIFCDPPTFSNSSKMGKRAWDVQEGHAELLISLSRLLTKDGAVVFSCNLRNFKLDVEALAKAGVQAVDITDKTIPADFERNERIHHCFLLRRVQG